MYAYIKGRLVEALPSSVTVESGSIGYQILIPVNVFGKLPNLGEEVIFYTAFVVRELSHTLFGFLSNLEKGLFEGLMGVSGIGPKVALSLIGHLSMEKMQQAIQNHDILTISKVPGIGKKTAERLIVEMRDKLPHYFPAGLMEYAIPLDSHSQNVKDTMNALIHLGYQQGVAKKALLKALEKYPDQEDVGTLITESLKYV